MLGDQLTLFAKDLEVLDSVRLPSGLCHAAPGANYDRIWIRDNCYTGLAFWHAGETKKAIRVFQGLMKIMDRYSWKIDWILWEGKPDESYKRVHPRYDSNGFEIPEPWGFIQNDSIGLLLWCVAWLEAKGAKLLTERNVHLVQKLVWYLSAVRYWEDSDNGVWEEVSEIHSSSVGCCIAGLKAHQSRVMVKDDAIGQGERILEALHGRESFNRHADLAQLTLVWPLGSPHEETVRLVERELLREKGVIRYLGDEYEALAGEPEWTMGLPWLGLAWLSLGDREKAHHYLEWTDRVRLPNGLLPESYLPKSTSRTRRRFEPCPHTPLAWAHSLALILRQSLHQPDPKETRQETLAASVELSS